MSKVELPDGHSAQLRDPRKVSERFRRPVSQTLAVMVQEARVAQALAASEDEARLTPEMLQQADHLNDLVAVALIESWTYTAPDGAPLPITVEALLDLPGDAYDLLQQVTAPLYRDLMPEMSAKDAVTDGGEKVEDHPFGSSSDSSPGSLAVAQ